MQSSAFVVQVQVKTKAFVEAYQKMVELKAIYDEMGGGGWGDLAAYFAGNPGLEFNAAQFALVFDTLGDLAQWFEGQSPAGFAREQNLYRVMSL